MEPAIERNDERDKWVSSNNMIVLSSGTWMFFWIFLGHIDQENFVEDRT